MSEERRARTPWSAALIGLGVLTLVTVTLAVGDTRLETLLRTEWFDVYQRLFPRARTTAPVVIVEIDERSLAAFGQWPWPRARMAGLIAQIAAAKPAVIVIDALFVEPDQYAPHALAMQLGLDPQDAARLVATLPDGDVELTRALSAAPVVLAVAGIPEAAAQPAATTAASLILQRGGNALDFVRRYPGLLRNLPVLDNAARGHGALNADAEQGILRRLPTLIGTTAGHLVPGLAVEALRYLGGTDPLRVEMSSAGIRAVQVAGIRIPTDANGEWWLHFSRWEERPAYSAADVLRDKLEHDILRGRIVLIGYTALGLQDTVATPLGRMPGVEAHAEALENALAGRLLTRTNRTATLEVVVLLGLGVGAIASVIYWPPLLAILCFAATCAALAGGAMAAFVARGWLLDVANPSMGGALVLLSTLGAVLAETRAQRRNLHRELAHAREAEVRMQGEMDAARRIQLGMLPEPREFAHDHRFTLGSAMVPAKSVGGDLYDFFLLDERRLFLLVGDVSGKGLPSALFMALAKAQIRGAVLRAEGDPGPALSAANRALTHDNPEFLFLTVFAAELNLDTGALRWSNAGHDSPALLLDGALETPFSGSGPPLCALDDYHYETSHASLTAGAAVCLVTDGVTEANNATGELFGAARWHACLRAAAPEATAAELIHTVTATLASFVGDTEQADDITLLCLRRTT